MTSFVPVDSIEQIVGRRRHPTDHIARRIGQTVYILHSVEVLWVNHLPHEQLPGLEIA